MAFDGAGNPVPTARSTSTTVLQGSVVDTAEGLHNPPAALPQPPHGSLPSPMLTQQSAPTPLTRSEIVDKLIEWDGNVNLTAERLSKTRELGGLGRQVTVAEILQEVNEHDVQLKDAIRARSLLSVWRALEEFALALPVAIPDMKPGEIARSLTALATAMPNLLSDKRSGTGDSHDTFNVMMNQMGGSDARDRLFDLLVRANDPGPGDATPASPGAVGAASGAEEPTAG